MAKKKKKKPSYPKYQFSGPVLQPIDPYANMDPYTRQALGLPPIESEGESVPTGDSMGSNMAGGSPMTGVASAASEAGRAAGVAASDLFAVGLPLLNSLIPDNNKQKRPTPQMAYNPHPYGTGSSALYASGGDIISPIQSGELRVEDNQFSYLSPETINLGGDYHSEGGTNLQYGGNIVEAERGEPVSIGEDGQAVVWGNMYLPGTNKKFKSVAEQIAKEETKNTNLLGKATKLLQTSNPYNAYEALSFGSGKVMNEAAKLREESVRAEKDALANLQQSLLDYAELTGQKPEKISKQFKKGGKMPCFNCGGKLEDGGFLPIAGDEFNIAAYPNFPPEYPQSLEEAKSGFKLNPDHEGWCTPMSKPTCTGKRRQFAINAKNHFKKQESGGNVTRVRNEGKIKITEEIPQSILDAQMRAQMPQVFNNQPVPQQFAPQARPVQPAPVMPSQDITYETLTTAQGKPLYRPKFPKNWPKSKIKKVWNQIPDMLGGHEVLKGDAWRDTQVVPGWQYTDTSSSRSLPNVARPEHRPNNFRPAFSKLANGGTIEDIQEGQELDLTEAEYLYLQNLGYSFE